MAVARGLIGEEALADQPRPVAAHDRRHVGERKFRMILHAPRDRAVNVDLGRLYIRMRIHRQHRGAGRQRLDVVEMHRDGVEHDALPAYIGCSRPAEVSEMRRPMPISRPFGFARTVPPAATVMTCSPQQLPNSGVLAFNTARVSSICGSIFGPPS